MSETVLTVLKLCFLALLYLFLFRVVRVVIAETKPPADASPPPAKPRKTDRKALYLRVLEPAGRAGETFTIGSELTVGRAGGCGLVLADDTFVSQVHARVYAADGETMVEDLGSKNGTLVNGERVVAATRLRKGDRVQFGQTVTEVVR